MLCDAKHILCNVMPSTYELNFEERELSVFVLFYFCFSFPYKIRDSCRL